VPGVVDNTQSLSIITHLLSNLFDCPGLRLLKARNADLRVTKRKPNWIEKERPAHPNGLDGNVLTNTQLTANTYLIN
jgi:hypothetical protein